MSILDRFRRKRVKNDDLVLGVLDEGGYVAPLPGERPSQTANRAVGATSPPDEEVDDE